MKTLAAVLVCACLASALASPSWVHLENETVSATDKVSFKVALKPQNLEHLDSLFWSLSDPKSPFYGKFLNNDQIADLISLPESDLQRVENWLSKETVCDFNMRRSVHRDYLLVDTCVAQAQKIFPNLLPAVYEKEGTTDRIIRSKILVDLEENLYLLGVPTDLHELIAGVHEVTDVPMHWSRIGGDLYPILPWKLFDKELHISDILSYFSVSNSGIKDTTYTADNGQVKQSVIEFNNAAFAASDLADFQSRYGIPSNPIQKVVGKQSGALSLEAALDVQTITGIAQKVATWDFVFDSTATFIDVTETIMGTEGAPNVISCSWGGPESLLGKSAATAANISFMKFGLKGFTFLTAAGDSGPSLNPKDCNEYEAQFPGSSPYVLTVGGSSVEDFTHTQQAWIHSSGGFSSYFPRPAFQNDAVEHYLKTADMPSNTDGRYTTTGRAFPDVSGFGAYYPVCSSGSYQPIGGTSGAAPQFAGVISLINLHRYQNGLGPLGAVTPALYSLKNGVGTDITHGETYATSRYGCKGKYLDGYKAAAGWDATTGLGNPDFETLLAALGDLKSA